MEYLVRSSDVQSDHQTGILQSGRKKLGDSPRVFFETLPGTRFLSQVGVSCWTRSPPASFL